MLRSFTFLCLNVLYASLLTGQVQLPAASAAAFAYGKYADIPVSTFTGTGNVQVPIHTVTDGPLELPISLNYHTGGLQVNVPASSVGWGWNLNTGGMISRTIKGVSDFDRHQYGYYFNGDEVRAPTGPDDKVWGYDTQPDIFTFTVGSYSGKFFLDANREIQQIPKSDIKIELRSLSDIAQGFELTTPDGTTYSYGARFKPGAGHEVITAHDYSKVNGGDWWDSPDKEEDRTGYYLLSIESADRLHRIDLEYDRMLYWYVTQQACAEEFKYRKSNGDIDEVPTCQEGWMDYSIKSVYLKRIWTKHQEVTFEQETRNDLWTSQTNEARKPKRVRGITVETSGECINFDFLRSYFYDESGTKVRTKLDGVQKRSCNGSLAEPAWKFSYLGPKNGANAIGPRIDNHDIDHWGYYNYDPAKGHNDRDGDLTPQGTGMKVGGKFTPYGSANRESHEPAMLQGMLHSVTYPTGGSMKLDYEANRYQVPGPTQSGFSKSHTSLAGEEETPDTFSYYHSAEIAASPSAVWTMCIYPYGCGDDGGEPGEPGGPQYLKGSESPEKSVATATSSSSGGNGIVEIRTLTGKYVTGFGFNTASQHCQPNEYMSSHLTAGTSYKVVIRAECARVTVNLDYEGSPTEAICGGLRIKQTRVHDGISPPANDIVTDYVYTDADYPNVSSGQLFRKPTYAFRVNNSTAVFTSMSQVPLFEVDGLHLGYERVVVSQSGNGSTEYKYNFPTRTQDYASYPVKPTTNELGVGELIGSTVFDEAGQPLASTNTNYRQDERESFGGGSAAGYFFVKRQGVPYYTGSLSYKNLYTPYWMTSGIRRPSTVTTTLDGVSTTTEYTYHSLNLLPETVTTTNSNGDEHQQRFYFFDPTDLPFTDITQEEWEELNLKHLSYQTEQYHNGSLLDGSKTEYRFYKADGTSPSTSATDRLPVPWVYRQQRYERTYEASGSLQSGRWETQSTVARYNGYGQVRERQTPHWPSTTVNYNGDLAISTTSSEQTTTYIYEGDDTTTPEDDTRRIKQVIAVDGTSTSYTYDDFGRVKTITDDCQGITTTYTYTFRHNDENINFFQTEVAYPVSGDNRSALTTTKTRKYTDGLGRPLQTVAIGRGASVQDDVVSGVAYDRYGRVIKTYEPLGQPNNQGGYTSLATSLPGTVHTYESSPLNRPHTVTPAGLAYPTTYSYGTNTAEDGVLRDGTTTEYVTGSLRKHTVTDANGNHLISFTDKLGRQVLSRRLPAGGGVNDRLDTYSVHDGKGRVRHVLPPGSTTSHTNLIYSYQYNGADQVTKKLIPGRGWTEYMYNSKHLLHGYRDEYLKQAGHWYAYNYDYKGRIKAEGIYKSSTLYSFAAPYLTEPLITTTYGTEPHDIDRVKTVRTKILDGGDRWLTTTNYYTTCGLLDYQEGNNHLNITAEERTDYVYDAAGNILEYTAIHEPRGYYESGRFC